MSKGKIALALLLLFAVAFWWASGGKILPAPGALAKSVIAKDDGGLLHRGFRIVAIKTAVDAKINRGTYTKLRDIPLTLQQAIIAVEDNRFYRHTGVDIEGILRATLVNIQSGELQEGGSTITQQLVKNLFLTHERTWSRKGEEIILALTMEMRYSKEEILELYLNTIYFGSGANGISEAARIYFDKRPAELNLAESAMLAGLPNGPSLYSPYENYEAAKQRQAVVLSTMVRQGLLGPSIASEAREARLIFAK